MQTRIKFLTSGANSVIGAFGAGDILTTSAPFAAHLVDTGIAKYLDVAVTEGRAAEPADGAESAAKPKKIKRDKEGGAA